jgi:hypothetical protein
VSLAGLIILDMIKLPTGIELKEALAARQLSTVGLPRNANQEPMEADMQALLASALRDERDERLLEATAGLAMFTKRLVWATWALVAASVALVIATVALVLNSH